MIQTRLFSLYRAATLDERPARLSPTDWWLLCAATFRFFVVRSTLGHVLWAVLLGELAVGLIVLSRVRTLSPAARFMIHHAWLPTFLSFELVLAKTLLGHAIWGALLLVFIIQLVRHRHSFWRSDVEVGQQRLQVYLGMVRRSIPYGEIASVGTFAPKRLGRLFNPALKHMTVELRLKPKRVLRFLPGPRRLRLGLPPEDAGAFIDAVNARLLAA